MILVSKVEEIVREWIDQSDCFLVSVAVQPGNVIVIEIDRNEGVDIDRCVALNRFIEERLDREVEDYELEVGSAGVTSPFKVIEQYRKNVGNEVEVLAKDGKKYAGVLSEVTEEGFSIERQVKKSVEGSKKKQLVDEVVTFAFEEVKQCKYNIKFK